MPKLAVDQIPSYRLHKQSGQAIVTLSGRDFLLGKYDTPESRSLYGRCVAEWLANDRQLLEPAVLPGAAPRTLNDLYASFVQHADRYYRRADGSATTEPKNFRSAWAPVLRLYGSTPNVVFLSGRGGACATLDRNRTIPPPRSVRSASGRA